MLRLVLAVAVARARLLLLFCDLFCLVLEAVEVPFRGLVVGERFDEGCHGHGGLFFLGEWTIEVASGEDAWDEAAGG